MKSKIQNLTRGIIVSLILIMLISSCSMAATGLTLQEATLLEKLTYGELGSTVRKIEEYFNYNSTLYISTETQLRALAEYVNNGNSCKGKKIELVNDITLKEKIDWNPIGTVESEFSGTFEGNGYSINGLKFDCYKNYQSEGGYSAVGLFGVVSNQGKVIKVNVNNSQISSGGLDIDNISCVGNIAGINYGQIIACTADSAVLGQSADLGTAGTEENNFEDGNNYIGRIIGWNKGTYITSEEYAGDINSKKLEVTVDKEIANPAVKISLQVNGINDFGEDHYFKAGETITLSFTVNKLLYYGHTKNNVKLKLEGTPKEIENIDSISELENLSDGEVALYAFPLVTFESLKQAQLSGMDDYDVKAVATPVSAVRNLNNSTTTLTYTYTVEENVGLNNSRLCMDFQNGLLSLEDVNVNSKTTTNVTCFDVYNEMYDNDYYTGNVFIYKARTEETGIYCMPQNPELNVTATVQDKTESGRYKEGTEIVIEARTTSIIKPTEEIPEIDVIFSKSGKGKYNYNEDETSGNARHINSVINNDGTTSWIYSYIIQTGDEGDLSLEYVSGKLVDPTGASTTLKGFNSSENIKAEQEKEELTTIIDNYNNRSEADQQVNFKSYIGRKLLNIATVEGPNDGPLTIVYKSTNHKFVIYQDGQITGSIYNIYADTIPAVVEIIPQDVENSITNKDEITYEFKFNEKVEGFTFDSIKVNNGIKGELSEVKQNEDGTYSYTMNISNTVLYGNTADLQVVVEKGACIDIVGHEVVRTESLVRIDKKPPVVQKIETNVLTTKNINNEIGLIRENYGIGDKIQIIVTLDENIQESDLPKLAIAFSKSGNVNEYITGTAEGNKIIYEYTIKNGDLGNIEIKGFTEDPVKDFAGNTTIIRKKNIEGNTIYADGVTPVLNEFKVVSPDEGKRNGSDTIIIEATFSEDIYCLVDGKISNIIPDGKNEQGEELGTAPELKLTFDGKAGIGKAIATGYGKNDDGSIDKTKIIYEYKITGVNYESVYTLNLDRDTNEEEGDNGILEIDAFINKNYGTDKEIKLCDLSGNEAEVKLNLTGNEITADTVHPYLTEGMVSVISSPISNTNPYYKAGTEIELSLKFNEIIKSNYNSPSISIAFIDITNYEKLLNPETSEEEIQNILQNIASFKTLRKENWTAESDEIKYNYTLQDGDNGAIIVRNNAGQFIDLAGNLNKLGYGVLDEEFYADTLAPTTVLHEEEVVQNGQDITVTVWFSENIYALSGNSKVALNINNAPELEYHFTNIGTNEAIENSGATIKATTINSDNIVYKFTKNQDISGDLKYNLLNVNLCDYAGILYYTKKVDTIAPTIQNLTIESEEYARNNSIITIATTFDEPIKEARMQLKIFFEDSGTERIIDGQIDAANPRRVLFDYALSDNDMGRIIIKDVQGSTYEKIDDEDTSHDDDLTYGWVMDLAGNRAKIFNLTDYNIDGDVIADTSSPTLEIKSNVTRTNKTRVKYTFTWSEDVKDFTSDDIIVTNGEKSTFTKVSDSIYTLEVKTEEDGKQAVRVNDNVCTDVYGNPNKFRVIYSQVYIDHTKPTLITSIGGGTFVIGTDSKKSSVKEVLNISEELESFKYCFTKDVPEDGDWEEIDLDELQVKTNITLNKEFTEEGRYYLYISAKDLAGNDTEIKLNEVYNIKKSDIIITPDITVPTRGNVIANITYGEGLTENIKAGVSGKYTSPDDSVVIVSENGTVYVEACDKQGNKVYKKLEVTNIDREAPIGSVEYTANEDNTVTAKITFNEQNVTITNNDGKDEYVFSTNGEFTFKFKDEAGNAGTATATVTSIIIPDTTAPEITFEYTVTSANTGDSIGATILTDEDAIIEYNWKFEGNNQNIQSTATTSSEYIRSINATNADTTVAGTYTLIAKATDKAGNSSTKSLEFRVLENQLEPKDTKEPNVTFNTNGGNFIIDTQLQKSKVAETLEFDERLSSLEYIWSTSETMPEEGFVLVEDLPLNSSITLRNQMEEGKYYLYIKAKDIAGNELKTKTNAYIITKAEITLTPDTTTPTNKDVTVDVVYESGITDNKQAGISGKSISADPSKVIVTENASVYAEGTDKQGNKVFKTLEINNIDKIAPTAQITYTTQNSGAVVAKLNPSEEVTITNNNGKDEYVFTQNGTFEFEFKDAAGNTGSATATVTTIVTKIEEPTIVFSELPIVKIGETQYVKVDIDKKPSDITSKINQDKLLGQTPVFTNLTEDGRFKTGSIISLNDKEQYKVIVKGDLDGDGKIGFIEDILLANNYRIGAINSLTEEQKIAADINENGKIEVLNDIIPMNNYRLGIISKLLSK